MVLKTIFLACVNLVMNVLNAVLFFIIPRPVIADTQANRARNLRLTTQFIQNFEEKYGTVHPDFFHGSYSQALDTAKRDFRFFMVILESGEHDDNAKFNRETLTSVNLLMFLQEHEVLVWVGDVKDPEAFQVSDKWRVTTFPFVAIVALQNPPGNMGLSPKMTLVDRIEARLNLQISRYGPVLQRFRFERAERDATRQIREQQDSAYLLSLQADQEKEQNWRRWALTKLPDEPSRNETNVANLSFKLSNGERVVRRFRANDTVEMIYTFVDTYHLRTEENTLTLMSRPPIDYNHKFEFLLVSPYPRTVHHSSKHKTIKEEGGLWPSASLIVENDKENEE
ncbi:7891_t:CDS:2 [Diversispora eburnea]|uniref:7891_t:CDS:1 n=2 Tax=Diversisporales TaxID=214509 RepID=A0A9N9BIQ7_9GLOM|nr:7891_t:CDS:2 [Diversispora eburnea]